MEFLKFGRYVDAFQQKKFQKKIFLILAFFGQKTAKFTISEENHQNRQR